jgi:putative endopeptidase
MISLAPPQFYAEFNRILQDTPLTTIKAYLKWNVFQSTADLLSEAFVNENFRWSQVIYGLKVLPPR